MAIASLSLSAALPSYNSLGSNGTLFAKSKGDTSANVNDSSAVLSAQSNTQPVATGLPSSLQNVTTIGELLLQTSGFSNQSATTSDAAGILAASLDPNIDLGSGTPLQISSFINTSADAFPSAAAPAPKAASAEAYGNLDSRTQNSNAASSVNNANTSASIGQNGPSAGAYSSVASSSASTIRGGNLNVVT